MPAIRCGRQFRYDPERLAEWARGGGAGGWRRERTDVAPKVAFAPGGRK